ncbi:dehydrodolichyl diphosphate synthase complex subunit DHDDS [Nasonia vitripennis]|uniref:Alkyl transferase n=1 Tax=Nasonia vitripennis TaxID=7425 RepID=A0A7M7H9U4_NASVI|nr:dehydrodolichyl diphosphate synthase complex subunit DHDDS [Nasonia vitripennis]XP_031782503.1 dehydrodolichyl diphosphate synthase complex subunit DHDDS [Nasonia vitripennis]
MSWIAKNTLTWLQSIVIKILRTGNIPRHVAIIMDGNRRYANKIGVERLEGHSKGFEKLAETLQWCLEFGIPEVTVYAFSIENFKRSDKEVDGLMDLARRKFQRLLDERDKLMEHGVCIRIIGNLSFVPQDVRSLMAEAMRITKDNNKAFLNVAFSYTSRDEITNTVSDIVRHVKNGDITVDDIDENLFSKCLYTHNSEDPDLLIRTSGEVRFSDFLMWQTSHTCVYFTKVLWPEFSAWDLIYAVFYYQRCYSDIMQLKNDSQDKVSVLNNRTSNFVKKLHKERDTMLESTSHITILNGKH